MFGPTTPIPRQSIDNRYSPYNGEYPHGSGVPNGTSDSRKSLSTAPHGLFASSVFALSVEKKQILINSIVKIKPRDVTKSLKVWRDQLDDALRNGGLLEVARESRPTIDSIRSAFPGISEVQGQEFLVGACAEYDQKNEDIFAIVKPTLDLEGTFYDLDLREISEFKVGNTMRDGVALIRWVHQFRDKSSTLGQIDINDKLAKFHSTDGRLNANASLSQIALHNDEYTQLWRHELEPTPTRGYQGLRYFHLSGLQPRSGSSSQRVIGEFGGKSGVRGRSPRKNFRPF